MKPHFIKAMLLNDGSVELHDNDGEIFHVEMRRDQAWPLMSRRARRFELMENSNSKPEPEKYSPFTVIK